MRRKTLLLKNLANVYILPFQSSGFVCQQCRKERKLMIAKWMVIYEYVNSTDFSILSCKISFVFSLYNINVLSETHIILQGCSGAG